MCEFFSFGWGMAAGGVLTIVGMVIGVLFFIDDKEHFDGY